MNNLLKNAQGDYFTWQFDDDIYSPSFLESIYDVFQKNQDLPCVYSRVGYIYGEHYPNIIENRNVSKAELISSRTFIPKVLNGTISVAACCGVFKIDKINNLGGIEKLCDTPIAIHSEFLLLIHLYKFNKIGFIPDTLLFSRDYEGTFSGTTIDYKSYRVAGLNLLKKGIKIHFEFCNDKNQNNQFLQGVLTTIIQYFIMRAAAVSILKLGANIKSFTIELIDELKQNDNLIPDSQIAQIEQIYLNKLWIKCRIKALLKWHTPSFIYKIIKKNRAKFSRLNI